MAPTMTPREAGEAAFYECEGNNEACLKAAFDAYEAAAVPVAIKPLDWRHEAPYSVARVLGGHYSVERHEGGVDLMGTFIRTRRGFDSVHAAKAAAQADFEAKIRSVIIPFSKAKEV